MKRAVFFLRVLIGVTLLFAISFITEGADMNTLTISSPAFRKNEHIPSKYTCDGADVNPQLVFSGVPDNAKSLALIADDPDAPRGTWVHWVVWNIDPGTREIKENSVPAGAKQGINDFRNSVYNGPCPPPGTHRYFFKLYALDASVDPGPKATKAALEAAMKGHVIAQAEFYGLYKRK